MGNVTVTGSLLQSQFNDSTTTATQMEVVCDNAINTLNIYLNTALSNLSGSAGSKTGTYTSAQAGGILAVSLPVYREMWKHADGENTGGLGALSSSYTPTIQLLNFAERIARQLNRKAASDNPPLYVSNDPVPTS
jgi:hypothetical protein